MRAIGQSVLVAALFIGLVPVTAEAQRYTADFGINGGLSWYSEMLNEQEAGFDGARFNAGWLVGSQLTLWARPTLGIRANMTYTDRAIKSDTEAAHLQDGDVLHGNINLWSGSGDLMIRFRAPNESWMGRETLPYLALGVGAKWVNPAGDFQTCVDPVENKTWECAAIHPTQNVSLAVGERSVVMGLIGLGADFRMSPGVALRLEVNDRIYKPPVYRIQSITGNQLELANSDSRATNYIHEVGAQLGLHFLMGLRSPPVVAVTPPPAPPPPPPPPPAEPPPPREDAITVCVVDPATATGARMQTAVFRHAQGDTVVTIDGQRRPLREVVPTGIRYARGADWLVRGEPLTLTIGRESARWLPYQTATMIQPDRVVYIGNVNGYPVYADRDEVADVIATINTARAGSTTADLSTILATQTQARNTVMDVAFLYTPLDPLGCVFQPLQRVVDVIKGKQQ